jgi:hypothetical protein
MFHILMELHSDPLTIYLESSEIHTLFILESSLIDLIWFPSIFQILIDLSSDPLMMYLESLEMQTLYTAKS